jgi:hypothetical protein
VNPLTWRFINKSKIINLFVTYFCSRLGSQKVLFSIKSRVSSLGNIPIKVSNNLFDKLVQPVLTYNAEISFMELKEICLSNPLFAYQKRFLNKFN